MPFQLCVMSADGFCFHLTTFSGFRDQTAAGSQAEHQKCNNHFAKIITVESQVQLELVSPTRSADVGKGFTADQSMKDHQIKAHNGNAKSEQLQDLGCQTSACILPFCDENHSDQLDGPIPNRLIIISSVSRQRSTFLARLLLIKIKPLSPTPLSIVPFVE